jgi:hypothetical protein
MPTIEIQLPPMHAAQRAIFLDKTRHRIAVCGRRFGKSVVGQFACIETAGQGGIAWWIAPSYPQATLLWNDLKKLVKPLPVRIKESDRMITLTKTGGIIQIKSADNPETLVGAGLDLAVLDEAALMSPVVWQSSIRPALSDKRGRGLFLFTPKGVGNYTYKLYGYGLDPNFPQWSSHHYPTSANPHILPDEIEQARLDMPDRIYREMYLAEFISDSDGVFRGILEVCILTPQAEPAQGHRHVFGLDWGRTNDFTAISVFDVTAGQEVALDRFNQIGYAVQRDRIKALYEKWRPTVILAETNSIGGPNIEALQADGLPVQGFDTTNASKEQIINSLTLAFERTSQGVDGGIFLLDDPVGISELQSYEAERLPSGKWRYGGKGSTHDDTVIARALAWSAASYRSQPSFIQADHSGLYGDNSRTRNSLRRHYRIS